MSTRVIWFIGHGGCVTNLDVICQLSAWQLRFHTLDVFSLLPVVSHSLTLNLLFSSSKRRKGHTLNVICHHSHSHFGLLRKEIIVQPRNRPTISPLVIVSNVATSAIQRKI